jgi:uncharacterized protein YbjT (DUF2867 family)
MIAVLGASGNVGSKVAERLLQEGEDVRVLEHGRSLAALEARGARVVRGDAAAVDDLRALFGGADAALVLLPEDVTDPHFVATRSKIAHSLARALSDERVGHVVALSAVGANRPDAVGPPAGLREYEQRLRELEDANVLVLRSASYMDYLLASLPLIESQGINGSAIEADLAFPMIATGDVAAEAAERLARRDFEGYSERQLLGPEDVSMREATAALGAALGRPELPYVQFPPADVQTGLVAAGMAEEVAALLVEMQLAINDGAFFTGIERTPESTTPTRLAEFLQDAVPSGGAA